MFAPGSFFPLLNKLYSALDAERVVTVTAPDKPGKFDRLDVKSSRDDIKIFAPDQVLGRQRAEGQEVGQFSVASC